MKNEFQAYIQDQWKYVNGSVHNRVYDQWLHFIDPMEKHSMAEHYGKSILSSVVGEALKPYSTYKYDISLATLEIERLRSEATIKCKHPTVTENGDIYECNPLVSPCLFDILADPCEQRNLAKIYPDILKMMESDVLRFAATAQIPRNQPDDVDSNPAHFNGTWTWWYDVLKKGSSNGASALILQQILLKIGIIFIIHSIVWI